ncbi:MAG: 2,3-bisphosphoglycerate-independent phosphoglycerate mutase, partial [Anaerolineae bacterium]|nr:2,3-bisphosphoglycerate-independent phosphoglycerate mutase [Anaerolineae bacterium]
MNAKRALLVILDGWGHGPDPKVSAIAQADTPFVDSLYKKYPHSELVTYGEDVGLPEGQMGNSEVGHLNIGAGRVVEQWLMRITRELQEGALQHSPQFQAFLRESRGTIHLVGLYSDGGVHSDGEHLHLLIEQLKDYSQGSIALHLITDGRDTSPHGAAPYIKELEDRISQMPNVHIASVCGRFYAMDRDKRWERVETAYHAITGSLSHHEPCASEHIKSCYENGITDEFVEPFLVSGAPISEHDSFLFWNFRADRMREIVRALCLADFDAFQRNAPLPSRERVLCFTQYDSTFGLPILFAPQPITNHIGEVVSAHGWKQLRTAETEKYPHVTYFLNGGVEAELPGEVRKLVPSPRDVKTYDLKPEMSAQGVTQEVLTGIQERYPFIVVNFANADMVGHTGVLQAGIQAVETVDRCLNEICQALEAQGGQALIGRAS